MSVLAGAQRRRLSGPYCEAMTAPPSGCARDDCCRRRPEGDTDDIEAIVARVVVEMLEQHIEPPRPGRTPGAKLDAAAKSATAIQEALRAAVTEDPPAGASFGASSRGSLRVVSHPDAVRDRDGVERCRITHRRASATQPVVAFEDVVVDYVMVGGLSVVTNRYGSWIVHSPAMPPAVTP